MARLRASGAATEPDVSPLDLMRDMDAHLAAIGIDPAAYPWYGGLAPARAPWPRTVPADVRARWGRPSG